jgi:hypothetical protein
MNDKSLISDETGQILLITGVTIIVIVIASVTLWNLASFTQVKKGGGREAKNIDTFSELTAVEANMERAIRMVGNDPETSVDEGKLQEYANSIDADYKNLSMRNGRYVRITNVEVSRDGRRIWRPAYGSLDTPETTNPYIKNQSTEMSTLSVKIRNVTDTTPGNAFNIILDGSETVQFVENSDGDVIIERAESGHSCEARADMKPVTVNVLKGTMNGVECEAISEGINRDATVQFENGDDVEASLNLVTEADSSGYDAFNYDGEVPNNSSSRGDETPTSGDSLDAMQEHKTIYSATGDVTVHTKESTIETEVKFVPHINRGGG